MEIQLMTLNDQLTPDGFRRLDEDVIFIAGSQDVQYVRERCEQEIRKALDDLAVHKAVRPFSWDLEKYVDGMDQRLSMQHGLPKPSDEHCLGVICLIGERIGYPLQSTFRLDIIPEIEVWTVPDHRYRLLHPWPDDSAEQEARLDEGCYPLTGTVFEFLEARGSRKPIWLGVLAERTISPGETGVQLNGNRFRTAKTSKMTTQEAQRWMSTDYEVQTKAVYNFISALVKNGVDQHANDDESWIGPAVRAFVIREIIQKRFSNVNPYKLLAHYGTEDCANFFGRDPDTALAVSSLRQRFETPGAPNTLSIVGASGCGKSSFLYAGILHGLMEAEHRGLYQTVAFRPEAFMGPDGKPRPVIATLLQKIDRGTNLRISAADIDTVETHPNAPQAAVELLSRLLAQSRDGRGARLVVGIDQFEEIVDQLAIHDRFKYWDSLIRFIVLAAGSPSLGMVYTLENARHPALERLQLGPAFSQAEVIELNNNSDFFFLTEIIDKPFKKEGYPLSRKVVAKLRENARALMRNDGQRIESSLLPLIALKLSKLFDKIQNTRQPIEPELRGSLESSFDQEAENSLFIKLSEVEEDLDFEEDISEQARFAWQRAGKGEEIDLNALDYFLKPFVGIGGENGAQIQLLTAPPPEYFDERKLAESFRKARLLVDVEGRLRLVHEAVIRFWPAASEWFAKRRDYLRTEEWMRREADAWVARAWTAGSLTSPENGGAGAVTESKIGAAAEILTAYFRPWTLAKTQDQLQDNPLYAYCKEIFRQSKTPSQPIPLVDGSTTTHTLCAASYGLTDLLQVFHEIDPESLDRPSEKLGRKPLMNAAWNWPETVGYLLSKGVDPIAKDKAGWPAITASIMMGNTMAFKLLLRASEGRGLDCPGGLSLLHMCARYNQLGMARTLIEDYGFKPDATADAALLPLHSAAIAGRLESFEFFRSLSDVKSRQQNRWNSLHWAAFAGNLEIVSSLLHDSGFRTEVSALTEAKETALHLACKGRKAQPVRQLTPFLDPNQPSPPDDFAGDRPIHMAFRTAYKEWVDQDDVLATVRALLEDERTDPNIPDRFKQTPLALAQKYPQVQRLLLGDSRIKPMESIGSGGPTPLSLAAQLGYWQEFGTLADRAEVDVQTYRDAQGNTLLHLLAERNAPHHLLNHFVEKADTDTLNVLNQTGYTPFLTALKNRQWHLADQLLSSGKLEVTKRAPATPSALLFALSGRARPDMIERLLAADPQALEAKDFRGWTLLHHACAHQLAEWLEDLKPFLASRPELWALTDEQGRRPIDLLRRGARAGWPGAETAMDWPTPKTWNTELVWEPISSEARVELAGLINPVDDEREIGEETEITAACLPFYCENVRLLRLRDARWSSDNLTLYYLRHEDELYRLDGTSPPIHRINAYKRDERSLLVLTKESILDYLRFFCFFVRGEEGPFLITESIDQEEIPHDLARAEQTVIANACHPAWLSCLAAVPGTFFASALVYYSNAVFGADFKVLETGVVEMLDDEPVAANLSQRIHRPVT